MAWMEFHPDWVNLGSIEGRIQANVRDHGSATVTLTMDLSYWQKLLMSTSCTSARFCLSSVDLHSFSPRRPATLLVLESSCRCGVNLQRRGYVWVTPPPSPTTQKRENNPPKTHKWRDSQSNVCKGSFQPEICDLVCNQLRSADIFQILFGMVVQWGHRRWSVSCSLHLSDGWPCDVNTTYPVFHGPLQLSDVYKIFLSADKFQLCSCGLLLRPESEWNHSVLV